MDHKEAKAYLESCPSKPCKSCPDKGTCSAYLVLRLYGDLERDDDPTKYEESRRDYGTERGEYV